MSTQMLFYCAPGLSLERATRELPFGWVGLGSIRSFALCCVLLAHRHRPLASVCSGTFSVCTSPTRAAAAATGGRRQAEDGGRSSPIDSAGRAQRGRRTQTKVRPAQRPAPQRRASGPSTRFGPHKGRAPVCAGASGQWRPVARPMRQSKSFAAPPAPWPRVHLHTHFCAVNYAAVLPPALLLVRRRTASARSCRRSCPPPGSRAPPNRRHQARQHPGANGHRRSPLGRRRHQQPGARAGPAKSLSLAAAAAPPLPGRAAQVAAIVPARPRAQC